MLRKTLLTLSASTILGAAVFAPNTALAFPLAWFATPSLGRVLGATARRWRRLTASLFDPYRPELHYMRGPGPKWREKHARGAG
jgi:hypothetical protein